MKNDDRTREIKTLLCCKKFCLHRPELIIRFPSFFFPRQTRVFKFKNNIADTSRGKNMLHQTKDQVRGRESSKNAASIKGVQVELRREDVKF